MADVFAVAVGSLQINETVVPHKAQIRPEIVSHAEFHALVRAARSGGAPMRPEVMTQDDFDELVRNGTLVEPIAVLDTSEAQAALDARDARIEELMREVAQLRAEREMNDERAPQEPESVAQTPPSDGAAAPVSAVSSSRVSKRRG